MSKTNETIIELSEELVLLLQSQLKSHDWFYAYSDDQRYWSTGSRQRQQISDTMGQLCDIGKSDTARDLYNEYCPDNLNIPERF